MKVYLFPSGTARFIQYEPGEPFGVASRVNYEALAADIVSRLDDLLRDSKLNAADIIAGLIKTEVERAENQQP